MLVEISLLVSGIKAVNETIATLSLDSMSNFDPKDPDDWKGLGFVCFVALLVYSARLLYGPQGL